MTLRALKPVMRPVFMADAADLSLRAEDKAFLLGGDIMVIPRWANQVAEPDKGTWQQFTLEKNALAKMFLNEQFTVSALTEELTKC